MEKPKKQFRFKKRDGFFLLAGILLAFGVRFSLVDAVVVHHHANFAIYVNGVRDEFRSPTFYEEISSCSSTNHDDPKARVHMHNNENDTVHVHDAGSTWADFFANMGYSLGNKSVTNDAGTLVTDQNGKTLVFVLNGKEVNAAANLPIESEDKLLVSYGTNDSSKTIADEYASISGSAREHNAKPDPASCSGSAKESIKNRFIRTVGISAAGR